MIHNETDCQRALEQIVKVKDYLKQLQVSLEAEDLSS